MRYGDITKFQTGVAIPVSSLRTELSEGIGDFLDLISFAEWAKECGIDLIQILPINDTGEEISPYSARSAFALNPVFLRLNNIFGSNKYIDEIKEIKNQLEKNKRCSFLEVVRFKRKFLRKIYNDNQKEIAKDLDFIKWIEDNSWVKNYSVYCSLKEKNNQQSWVSWKTYKSPTPAKLSSLWDKFSEDNLYHAWMQFECEKQLKKASKAIGEMGLKLKGDIPILVNEDSADVWSEIAYFDLSKRAGAPPDMYSYSGQNWGFPCYNWSALEKDDFSWWKARLGQASKYYHAYRIDHVLGFFRIWAIPNNQATGMLGHFEPSVKINESALRNIGLPLSTINYLTNPNYNKNWLLEKLNGDTKLLDHFFKPLKNDNERYEFRVTYDSEQKIYESNVSSETKDVIISVYWNRIFTPDSNSSAYYPIWTWESSAILQTLPQHEQKALTKLVDENRSSQENYWAENGRKLLKMMANETDMLVCAEDLGVVPDSVPDVLNRLSILGLRIGRWTRKWKEAGQPYILPKDYPRLSVASSSSHDSSTLAGWWEELNEEEKRDYMRTFGLESEVPREKMDFNMAKMILKRFAQSNSLICVIPFQDFCKLDENLILTDSQSERINVPGTMNSTNWTWRISETISKIKSNEVLKDRIKKFSKERKDQPIWDI